jgi:hypothetical protein
MSIEIDKVPLVNRVVDKNSVPQEIRNVSNIAVSARRAIVEHKIPGLAGSVLQDMGKEPIRISFEGDFYGEKVKDSMQVLWTKFKDGKPVPFSSDISGITDVAQVMIEEFSLADVSGSPNRFHYSMALCEYVPPKQGGGQPASQQGAKQEVEKASEVHDIKGKVVDDDGKPMKGADVKIKGPAGEYNVKTDEKGEYLAKDVAEGKYEITVGGEGFEKKKSTVEVKKGGGEGGGGEEGGGETEGEGGEESGGEEGAESDSSSDEGV